MNKKDLGLTRDVSGPRAVQGQMGPSETPTMSEEAQRIAIALACGRKRGHFYCPACKTNIRY